MAVDTSVSFKAYAALSAGAALEPWTYHPRVLGVRDIEIKISHCGICGSDVHCIDNGWKSSIYPIVVGHEIVGEVTAAGAEVKDLKVGDRVGVGAQCYACLRQECFNCSNKDDQCCPKAVFTYSGLYEDGEVSKGGYADRVRLLADYAFKIPEVLPSDVAAPLLCAGITVYAPLKRHGVKPGVKVGIVGMGGLGHLAVQFANALGGEVSVVSHSASKKEEATKLGAHHFINSSVPEEVKAADGSLDVLLVTANYKGMDWSSYLTLIRTNGRLVMVGIPEEEVKFQPFNIIMRQIGFYGSIIGSTHEIKDMLEFAAKHKVHPWIERIPIQNVNEAIARMHRGDVRYRFVLENKFE
eukprot:TRINITY_DN984_c0_g2_i1.p1 TRINITY_DN984_c0_g2~~TRINITY_DN984_c0_g2_i1.p1  ORF type:complete len:354 (+),score=68.89 TRINITY_DN984_c0_g2_i1:76-1137(+)